MSRYILRTDSTEPVPTGGGRLDWFDDDPRASTIAIRPSRRLDARPSAGASALMRFAATVAAVDKIESRSSAGDGWTRDLELSVPGARLPALDSPRTVDMLRFLTGDAWTVERRRRFALAPIGAPTAHGDVVCLLSGGLDSLVGAIDLLAGDDHRRAVLASVEDQPVSVSRQTAIVRELRRRYPDRVDHVSLYVDSAKVEDTTRARSFLFIAFGLLCASAIGPDVPLFVPENGMIGLNAPLIGTRSGSASTRTTHPHFIAQLREVVAVRAAHLQRTPERTRSHRNGFAVHPIAAAERSRLRRTGCGAFSCQSLGRRPAGGSSYRLREHDGGCRVES